MKTWGRVALFQPPTKMVVAQFQIFWAIAGAFLSTFWGSFGFFITMGPEICSSILAQTRPQTLYAWQIWRNLKFLHMLSRLAQVAGNPPKLT